MITQDCVHRLLKCFFHGILVFKLGEHVQNLLWGLVRTRMMCGRCLKGYKTAKMLKRGKLCRSLRHDGFAKLQITAQSETARSVLWLLNLSMGLPIFKDFLAFGGVFYFYITTNITFLWNKFIFRYIIVINNTNADTKYQIRFLTPINYGLFLCCFWWEAWLGPCWKVWEC